MSHSASRLLPATLALVSAAILLTISLTAAVTPPGFPPFSEKEYKPAALGPKEPDLEVEYPGGAMARGIAKGDAVVEVGVDASGKATDYLLIGCSEMTFGRQLLEHVKGLQFQAAKFKGVAVPGRCKVGYAFKSRSVAVNPMEAARHRMETVSGTPLAFSAVAEKNLDHDLEFINVSLPPLPAGYPVADAKPVKVFVTFYIDEEGHARVPNVESAASPELIPGAIAAVQQWAFKPVTSKGKPAVVFTGRAVRFLEPERARVPAPAKP